MSIIYAPLFSGSSGNSVYIAANDTALLVDAGMPGAKIVNALKEIGAPPEGLCAILVTHAHSDHVSGVGVMSRRFDLPVYATAACWEEIGTHIGKIAPKNRCVIEPGVDLYFGEIDVTPFATPHDAAGSVGYDFRHRGARFALATDLGGFKKSWLECILGADAVLLESNYDEAMLEAGPYPYELKRRIASPHGHLSNDDAGRAAVELYKSGTRRIVLGHLSRENNTPELARLCCERALIEQGILPGEDIAIDVARRDGVTGVFEVE